MNFKRINLSEKCQSKINRYYGPSSQGYGFSSSHVWKWEFDYKGSWVLKNWCFWTVVLEKALGSPLDCKEIQPVHPKDQSWVFIGRTAVAAETLILWPLDEKNWLIWKDPDSGKDWMWEKWTTEDEMHEWHQWLNGLSLGKLWELVIDREAWHAAVRGVARSWTWLSDWTELNWYDPAIILLGNSFECWILIQLFHSPLSLSTRGSLVLCFLPQGWCHLCIWGYWYFSQ